jgi:hypothetical protein
MFYLKYRIVLYCLSLLGSKIVLEFEDMTCTASLQLRFNVQKEAITNKQ